jgi:hypothetical protein
VSAVRCMLLCALLTLPAWARGMESGAGRLHLSASPDSLRLAEGTRAKLRIVGGSEPPVLSASVGRVEFLRETSSGVYEAEYVPPESLDPQVAFVVALSADGFAWIPIVLSGIREVAVLAKYGTPVSVSVEDEVFGPVPADGSGRALVRVVVPPGVRTARYEKQRIDLSVPDKSLVHVFLSSSSAEANTAAEVTVGAIAVTERGKPRERAPISLVATEGSLSPAVEIENGVFEAHWKLPPGQVGQARITSRLRDKPASISTAALDRVPGPPRSISIEVDRDQLVAGEGDVLAVTARVLDVAGNPTECTANIAVEPGTVLEWERTGRGHFDGRVQVARRRAGSQQLEIRVVATRSLSARRLIPLLPGPPRQLRIEPEEELHADGQQHQLRVVILDRDGNRVDVAEAPTVTAARGVVSPPARSAPGAYRVGFRSPLGSEGYEEVIQARSGALEAEVRLKVRALGGGVVLAPKIGFTKGTSGLSSPTGGAELGFWTGALGPSFGLVLEAWFYSFSQADTLAAMELTTEVRYLALEASLGWRRPLRSGLFWLSAGGGAVRGSSQVSGIPGQASVTESTWTAGANGCVGWGRPLGPGVPFGEVRVAWQADPGQGQVRGAVNTVTLNVGYRFDVH